MSEDRNRVRSPLRESSNRGGGVGGVTAAVMALPGARRSHQPAEALPAPPSRNATTSFDLRHTEVQFLNSGLDVGLAPTSKGAEFSRGGGIGGGVGGGVSSSDSDLRSTSGSYILSEAKGAVPEVVRNRPGAGAAETKGGSSRASSADSKGRSPYRDTTFTVNSNGDLSRPRRLEKGK
jgi:hypothetical protein